MRLYLLFVCLSSIYRLWVSTRIPGVSKSPGKVQAPNTFVALTIGYAVIVIASVVEYFILRRDTLRLDVTTAGLLIYLFGIVGREWPVRTLNRFWSHQVEIRPDHELILAGPYRYVRHPNYLCLLCEVVGFPLVSNSYFAFILAIVIYVPVLRLRINHEEAALTAKFGSDYEKYLRHVPALFPMPGRTANSLAAEIASRADQTAATTDPGPENVEEVTT